MRVRSIARSSEYYRQEVMNRVDSELKFRLKENENQEKGMVILQFEKKRLIIRYYKYIYQKIKDLPKGELVSNKTLQKILSG